MNVGVPNGDPDGLGEAGSPWGKRLRRRSALDVELLRFRFRPRLAATNDARDFGGVASKSLDTGCICSWYCKAAGVPAVPGDISRIDSASVSASVSPASLSSST